VRAIEAGQAIAGAQVPAVQGAVGKADNLPPAVTALMALPGFTLVESMTGSGT
jgi:hypothetical protein